MVSCMLMSELKVILEMADLEQWPWKGPMTMTISRA